MDGYIWCASIFPGFHFMSFRKNKEMKHIFFNERNLNSRGYSDSWRVDTFLGHPIQQFFFIFGDW